MEALSHEWWLSQALQAIKELKYVVTQTEWGLCAVVDVEAVKTDIIDNVPVVDFYYLMSDARMAAHYLPMPPPDLPDWFSSTEGATIYEFDEHIGLDTHFTSPCVRIVIPQCALLRALVKRIRKPLLIIANVHQDEMMSWCDSLYLPSDCISQNAIVRKRWG